MGNLVNRLAAWLLFVIFILAAGCSPTGQPAATTTTKVTVAGGAVGAAATDSEQKIIRAAQALVPAVVNIQVEQIGGEAQGSGVIFRKDGYVITNNHVVEGAERITVFLASGAQEPASLVGGDTFTDIAVLRIRRTGLPVAPLGSSRKLKVGEFVLAVGSPLGFRHSVTLGIVSALGRAIPEGGPALVDLIQTDAPISPGNSGGALATDEGKVIGINVAAIRPAAGAQGLGFAVPIDIARQIADQLIRQGRVVHPFLGVEMVSLTPDLARQFNLATSTGAIIVDVESGSPAGRAGVEPGDIVVRVGDRQIASSEDVFVELRRHSPGDRVRLQLFRDSRRLEVQVVLGERR